MEEVVPGTLGLGIAVLVMTFLLLVFGEITPKTWSVSHAEAWARKTSGVMEVLTAACRPVSATLSRIGRIAARLTGVREPGEELTSQEILSLMELGRTEGVLGEEANVTVAFLTLNERRCDQAMVPRSRAMVLRREWSRERMRDAVLTTEYTRYPLIGSVPEQVLGYIDAREFLAGGDELMVHDIPGFPETAPLGDVLEELRKSGAGIGAVFDEYGDWVGIVSVEDILEAVVFQQLDRGFGLPPGVERLERGFGVPASIRLEVLSDLLGVELTSEYVETAGGLIEEVSGRIPSAGETFDLQGCRLTVLQVSGPRLERLLVSRIGEAE